MCLDIINWFNNDFLSLFSEKKETLKKIEPLVKIIIEEPEPEPIRCEPHIIYNKPSLDLDESEPDYTWDIL